MKAAKKLDIFPKANEDVKGKTQSGGIVTIVGMVIMFFLLVSEFAEYINPPREHTVSVDVTYQKAEIPISFSISFFDMNCSDVKVDIVDEDGDIAGKIDYLRKLPVAADRIYGSFFRPWLRTGSAELTGCAVSGHIVVPKSKGNIHVAAGATHSQQHSDHKHHIHRLAPQNFVGKFNVSHTIAFFQVGPHFPLKGDTLNGAQFVHLEKQVQYVYFMKFVPTLYESGGSTISSYQYSVSQHKKLVDFTASSFPLPGLFFKWEISPFMVKISENYSFSRFLTRVCAVIGGVFVVIGLVYKVTRAVYSAAKPKRN